MTIYNNIELIGQTPIVKLNNIVPEGAATSMLNQRPLTQDSVSTYCLSITEKAEHGILKPGATIVEATSGNTGIGLSAVGAAKGYKVTIAQRQKR